MDQGAEALEPSAEADSQRADQLVEAVDHRIGAELSTGRSEKPKLTATNGRPAARAVSASVIESPTRRPGRRRRGRSLRAAAPDRACAPAACRRRRSRRSGPASRARRAAAGQPLGLLVQIARPDAAPGKRVERRFEPRIGARAVADVGGIIVEKSGKPLLDQLLRRLAGRRQAPCGAARGRRGRSGGAPLRLESPPAERAERMVERRGEVAARCRRACRRDRRRRRRRGSRPSARGSGRPLWKWQDFRAIEARAMTPAAAVRRHHPRRRQGHADEIRPAQGAAPDRRAADARPPARRASTSSGPAQAWSWSAAAASRSSRWSPAHGGEVVVQEPQLGTGHAVLQAERARRLRRRRADPLRRHAAGRGRDDARGCSSGSNAPDAPAAVVLGFAPADPRQYGRVIADADGTIDKMVEYKDATDGGAGGRPVQFAA